LPAADLQQLAETQWSFESSQNVQPIFCKFLVTTRTTYMSFGSEPKQSPYIYCKCLCIYKTTKTLGTFFHSQNFEIKVLHIATKRIQTPENKFKPNSRRRKHLEFSRTLADLPTFQKPKYNLKTLLSLQNQSLGFVHPAQ
jgi:hypothetical protein